MNSRRRKFFISFLKYTVSLAVAILLFWLVYRDLHFNELIERFKEVDILLLSLSVFLGLISYYARAYRWNILLEPIGYNLKSSRTFLAIMIGYFANFILPRMGEFTRCAALKRTDNVDFTSSFGSVLAERALDILVLLFVTFIGFIIEFDKLFKVLYSPLEKSASKFSSYAGIVIAFIVLLTLVLFVLYFMYHKNKAKIHRNSLFIKVRSVVRELLNGLLSIRNIKRPIGFWLSTIAIWGLYFLMIYVIFLSFEPTTVLGVKAGVIVLIMGGIGMTIPVQGGIGSYHLLVSSTLLLYGIQEKDSIFFALISHTSQTISVLLVGGLSFILSMFIPKRDSKDVNI